MIASSNGIAQSYSQCRIFINLFDTALLKKDFTNIKEVVQGDTVFLNETFLKTLKQTPRVFFTSEYLRNAEKQELKDLEYLRKKKTDSRIESYINDPNDETFFKKDKIYKLVRSENPYRDWYICKPTNPIIRKYIMDYPVFDALTEYKIELREKKDYRDYQKEEIRKTLIAQGFTIEQINDVYNRLELNFGTESTHMHKMINRDIVVDNMLGDHSLKGYLLPEGSNTLNPETFLGKELIVYLTNKNSIDHHFYFKTLDNMVVINSMQYPSDWYPIFKTKTNISLSEKKNQFVKYVNNNDSIKSRHFVLDIFSLKTNYYKLKSITFEGDSLNLVVDEYDDITDKIVKKDFLVKYDTTMAFYDFECAWGIHNEIIKMQSRQLLMQEFERNKYLQENYTAKEIEYINKGRIFIGMSEKAVLEALGYPAGGVNETVMNELVHKQYVYDIGRYVYVENGRVIAWQKFDN